MIAYNYCFSTCLGPVLSPFPKTIGVADVASPDLHGDTINSLSAEGLVTVSSNRIAFIKASIHQGVLPKMLSELLNARVVIKELLDQTVDPTIRKILDARQLGLKYICNVTYGYTSAFYTGRMPCVDIADSIVQTARLTLERAMKMIEANVKWNARVIYGDTDSLFVKLPGRSLNDAFIIGTEMAKAVTEANPFPVQLKFEKVYMPCVLLAEKRYVGFKYESPDEEPVFDAKGIETVRRDSCPIVSKVLQRTITILFRTRDLSLVKSYLQRQFIKVLAGGYANMADFILSKEVCLGSYAADNRRDDSSSSDGEDGDFGLPPAALVAKAMIRLDPMSYPHYAQRIPFVVVYTEGTRLVDWVVPPEALLIKPLQLHSLYYITKQIIPAVSRILNLVGIDVMHWYNVLPRPGNRLVGMKNGQNNLDRFVFKAFCMICLQPCTNIGRICAECKKNQALCIMTMVCRLREIEMETHQFISDAKLECGCHTNPMMPLESQFCCLSIHCPLFWQHIALRHRDAPLLRDYLEALSTMQ